MWPLQHRKRLCLVLRWHCAFLSLFVIYQALDSDFMEENRRKCAEAARPLTDAVEELTMFASSPEFASKPAKISPQVWQGHVGWGGGGVEGGRTGGDSN